MFKVEKNNIL